MVQSNLNHSAQDEETHPQTIASQSPRGRYETYSHVAEVYLLLDDVHVAAAGVYSTAAMKVPALVGIVGDREMIDPSTPFDVASSAAECSVPA